VSIGRRRPFVSIPNDKLRKGLVHETKKIHSIIDAYHHDRRRLAHLVANSAYIGAKPAPDADGLQPVPAGDSARRFEFRDSEGYA
jgi:hypothetical protein